MGAIFSTSAGHKTNIKEIYVYVEKQDFVPTINIPNNSVDEITVYYDAKEFSPNIMGVENVNYIKI